MTLLVLGFDPGDNVCSVHKSICDPNYFAVEIDHRTTAQAVKHPIFAVVASGDVIIVNR